MYLLKKNPPARSQITHNHIVALAHHPVNLENHFDIFFLEDDDIAKQPKLHLLYLVYGQNTQRKKKKRKVENANASHRSSADAGTGFPPGYRTPEKKKFIR